MARHHGFGAEANNRTAVGSMTAYRTLRYGKHVDLILTDFHSYTMEDPGSGPKRMYSTSAFRWFGRSWWRSSTAASLPRRSPSVTRARPISARTSPPYTVLGREQKAWLKERLTRSTATWKIWGATNGTLDMRTDPQNLPAGLTKNKWPGKGFGTFGGGDFSSAFSERAEIYDTVRDHRVPGFVIISGDRHSFWAGYAAPKLPPAGFDPVGLSFINGSISAPGLAEAAEYMKPSPLLPLFVRKTLGAAPEATINLTIKHGVRSALEYAASGDIAKARAASNPNVSPHIALVDMAGHGYAVVSAGADAIDTEFVCIVRPIARAKTPDGGPLRYRVSHRAKLWQPGTPPKLEQQVLGGDAKLSI